MEPPHPAPRNQPRPHRERRGRRARSRPQPRRQSPEPNDKGATSTTAVGDSVMLAASAALDTQLPKVTVDAAVSRQPEVIFDRIRERKRLGRLGDVVVIGAGTNGRIRSADLTSILSLLEDRKRVVLVTCHADRSWTAQSNASIRSAGRRFATGNVVVVDWDTYAAQHPRLAVRRRHPPAARRRGQGLRPPDPSRDQPVTRRSRQTNTAAQPAGQRAGRGPDRWSTASGACRNTTRQAYSGAGTAALDPGGETTIAGSPAWQPSERSGTLGVCRLCPRHADRRAVRPSVTHPAARRLRAAGSAPFARLHATKHAGASSDEHAGASGDRGTADPTRLPPRATDQRPQGALPRTQ